MNESESKNEEIKDGLVSDESESVAEKSGGDTAVASAVAEKNMTEGVIWKQILFFALPILLSNVIQRLYNAVDSMVVGRYVGHEALAAVGSNNSIIEICFRTRTNYESNT